MKTVSTPGALKARSSVAIRKNVSRQQFEAIETWALATDQNPQNVIKYFINSAKTIISEKSISLTSEKHRAKPTEILIPTWQDTMFLLKFDVSLTAAEINRYAFLWRYFADRAKNESGFCVFHDGFASSRIFRSIIDRAGC